MKSRQGKAKGAALMTRLLHGCTCHVCLGIRSFPSSGYSLITGPEIKSWSNRKEKRGMKGCLPCRRLGGFGALGPGSPEHISRRKRYPSFQGRLKSSSVPPKKNPESSPSLSLLYDTNRFVPCVRWGAGAREERSEDKKSLVRTRDRVPKVGVGSIISICVKRIGPGDLRWLCCHGTPAFYRDPPSTEEDQGDRPWTRGTK